MMPVGITVKKTQTGREFILFSASKRLLSGVATMVGERGVNPPEEESIDVNTCNNNNNNNNININNLSKKNVDMSFNPMETVNGLSTSKIMASSTTLLNISSCRNKPAGDSESNLSCRHCSQVKGRRRENEDYNKNVTSSLLQHFCRYRSNLPLLPFQQLVILTILAFLTLLGTHHPHTLCSAQKLIFGKSHSSALQSTQNIVIPHIKYGQGLNRWSFLSVDRDNHGLHSDLLCPNPMMTSSPGGVNGYNNRGSGGGTTRGNSGRGNKQQSIPPHQQQQQYPQQSRFPGGQIGSASSSSTQHYHQPLPNEIWALKTDEQLSLLPCSLRQSALPPPVGGAGNNKGTVIMSGGGGSGRGGGAGSTRHNGGHFIENRILFINVSLVPFNFHGAIPCSKYTKLMYDEEEGTNLRCGDIPFDPKHNNKYHINWPPSRNKRKDYFSLLDNLERFLQNEQTLHRQFYFQIYFTSQINGRTKRCTVQQYELDLGYPAGNARFCNLSTTTDGGNEELCGEFHCDDLIFPLYIDPQQPHTGHHGKAHHGKGGTGGGRHGGTESTEDVDYEDFGDYRYDDDETSQENSDHAGAGKGSHRKNKGGTTSDGGNSLGQTHEGRGEDHHQDQHAHGPPPGGFSWSRMIKMDMRLLIFFTVVPLVLFGVLVFGLELIVYFMCCRKRRDEDDEGGGTRSQQLLENSLNVWENVPSRMDAQRTVSFSPMTTSIYGDRKNNHLQMMDATSLESHPETPKILKSALKNTKPGSVEHGSPTTAANHYFDYHDHDMPPSYIETTAR